jgi:hypothetical protein
MFLQGVEASLPSYGFTERFTALGESLALGSQLAATQEEKKRE